MNETMIVRGAPQEYICHAGAWNQLEEHLLKRKLKKVLILHGEKSWQVAREFFPELKEVGCHFQHYKNECTFENISYFVEFIKENDLDGIIAIGGGKVLDLGKAVAADILIPVICLPTLASTCAAYTPLSVIYNNEGAMVDMLFFSQSISLTLVDPEVILNSPKELLVAGIGDTLAKWYESNPVISELSTYSAEIAVAKFAAKECRDNLLMCSKQALIDLENKELTEDFIKIVETNILLAGMVGGFGDKYGRTSGAHSIHDAMTYIPKTKNYLHGNKVAYGILVQLIIEEKLSEVSELIPFYQEIGLPYQFSSLAITRDDLDTIAKKANEDPLMHLLPCQVTKEKIKQAMLTLETI